MRTRSEPPTHPSGGSQPRSERSGGRPHERFVGTHIPCSAGLIGLGVRQPIEIGLVVNLHEIFDHRTGDFRTSTTVAGEGKEKEGAIANPDEPVRTGEEHRLQGIPGQGHLGGRAHAARGVGAANPPHQPLDGGIAGGIGASRIWWALESTESRCRTVFRAGAPSSPLKPLSTSV